LKENSSLEKSLVRAVTVAIENIAFEEPELLPGPQSLSGEPLALSLQVVSPYLFQTRIFIEKELADRMTRTIYRDDDKKITDELLSDTIGEFLNTIIGTMMGDLTLGERVFEMGLPEVINAKIPEQESNSRQYFFRIDEQLLCIEIIGDVFFEE
jgi:hypothetical protein